MYKWHTIFCCLNMYLTEKYGKQFAKLNIWIQVHEWEYTYNKENCIQRWPVIYDFLWMVPKYI